MAGLDTPNRARVVPFMNVVESAIGENDCELVAVLYLTVAQARFEGCVDGPFRPLCRHASWFQEWLAARSSVGPQPEGG